VKPQHIIPVRESITPPAAGHRRETRRLYAANQDTGSAPDGRRAPRLAGMALASVSGSQARDAEWLTLQRFKMPAT
jgi:hypothetical protein